MYFPDLNWKLHGQEYEWSSKTGEAGLSAPLPGVLINSLINLPLPKAKLEP